MQTITSKVQLAWNDMLETENESLRDRVGDLEKKVLEQGDEIVCLRSTLADVLRRLNQVEGCRALSLNTSALKNGNSPRPASYYGGSSHHLISPTLSQREINLRYRSTNEHPGSALRDPVRRVPSHNSSHSSLPQRKAVHYQSTGSLHSDSPSSSSVSPVPPASPSPSPTRPGTAHKSQKTTISNLHNSKRWSSTGDFNQAQNMSVAPQSSTLTSRLATKSLLNLNLRSQPQQSQHIHHQKHGTRDATFNQEEGNVRMFLRGRPINLYAPSNEIATYDITKVATAPSSKLKLDWVYGYRGKDCRSNLYLLPTGEIVYFVASVAVLYNVEEQSQRHYLGHTDDIKCLAVHPNKLLIATGQTAGHDHREGKPHIRVWNSVSLATVVVLGLGEFERSISCLSFSKADGGTLLCAIDEGNDHNISVWDWQKNDKGHKITETKCSMDTVVAAEFHPLERNQIVTCGKGHISFWTLDAGGTLYKRNGIFDTTRDRPKYVTCLAFTQNGDVLSGDSNGSVITWGRGTNNFSKITRNVHEGSVFTICTLKEGSIITGGGKDGRLIQFDSAMQPTGYNVKIAEHLGGIRTLSEGRGSQLLVGSTRNCILIGSLKMGFSPAVLGHTDELWALCPHPTVSQFLTAGFDRIVQLWDSLSHSVVWSKDIAEQAQSAAFSTDGQIIIVGCTSGKWLVMDSETREIYSSHVDGNEAIQVVKFSPDGSYLALGSRDNYIYLYQVTDGARHYTRLGKCTSWDYNRRRRCSTGALIDYGSGHSSFITHLDWSADNEYLRSNSGDYELLYWKAKVCRQVPQSTQLRDVIWASNSCVLTFTSIGIWPEGADGTDVNACERSNNSKLMATGDDFGKVKLYGYPVKQPKSLCHSYGGHSSHVTNVAFLHDDSRLITIGGKDMSVIQWAII
ncbi:echinoderm microtubule-associated protein-like 2 isoform X2 [Daktulosphaira vitifoliae]|uniref:echinoderm microtubule-associated protein-like 2 isoform X2 n=1 Tax=Daktulosphaira vitifoliae TaxID=58002 RepID=UPI0021A9FA60|nr:echinoderm microtubule-associated protein-like 2 isoform X2 [Daktulosphaira vitifoliae]